MTEKKTIHELIETVGKKMREVGYSEWTLVSYETAWKTFGAFADERKIKFYTTEAGLAFLEKECKFVSKFPIKHAMEQKVRAINKIDEYYKYQIISTKRSHRKVYVFPAQFKDQVHSYIVHRGAEGLSKKRIQVINSYMERFTNYLDDIGLENISKLDSPHIRGFLELSNQYTAATVRDTFTCLRGFLTFIHKQGYLYKDLSFMVPSIRLVKERTIPSAYSKDEVEKILSCIDRCSIRGKRDYAMLSLAARLGLRSSDICGLTFSSLNWDKNMIDIFQEKTKKSLQLPLLNEVGDAIIDYLKLRPKSSTDYIFLRVASPPERLDSRSLYEIVSRYMRRAGIKIPPGKKHGPHSLRHSLSSLMLEKRVPLPVISEILSHTSTETTKVYLKIDLSHLRECALDVPGIGNSKVGV
jgi:integrase/recombinase XerD